MKFNFNKILIICAVIILSIFSGLQTYGQDSNAQNFFAQPAANLQSKGRNILTCVKGIRRFLSPPNGNFIDDVTDYWRDFFLWPSHYADVMNIENQVNKSRYAVISAYLRCDLDRLKSTINAYYKLEAELYFVRHYVDTEGGYLHILTERQGEKNDFQEKMLRSFIGRASEDVEKDRALFSAYFDEFDAKYRSRAKSYAGFGDDPVYGELSKRFDKLVETLQSFKELGNEIKQLGKETGAAVKEGAVAVARPVSEFYNSPGKALESALVNIVSRFQVCPSTGDPDKCKDAFGLAKSATETVLGVDQSIRKMSERKTYQEVQIAITQDAVKKTEDTDKGEMLARWEMLYGQVNGDGVTNLMNKMDELILTLGSDREFGTIYPLEKVQRCANKVRKKECK